MNTVATLAAVTALALAGAPASAASPTGEETLARMLEGRVAGPPVRCIAVFRDKQLRMLDRVGVVYDEGKTIYVARASDPQTFRDRDILIIERHGSELCREDVRRTVERDTGALESLVFLSDFVPYTRAG